MYGPRPAIIIEKLASAPPDNTLIKLSSCELFEEVNTVSRTCFKVCGSLSGTGICAKIRNTTKIPKTAKMRLRISLCFSERPITFQFIVFNTLSAVIYALVYQRSHRNGSSSDNKLVFFLCRSRTSSDSNLFKGAASCFNSCDCRRACSLQLNGNLLGYFTLSNKLDAYEWV